MNATEPNACVATNCHFLRDDLARCERERCPFAWQRRGSEDRTAREEADRRTRTEAERCG